MSWGNFNNIKSSKKNIKNLVRELLGIYRDLGKLIEWLPDSNKRNPKEYISISKGGKLNTHEISLIIVRVLNSVLKMAQILGLDNKKIKKLLSNY